MWFVIELAQIVADVTCFQAVLKNLMTCFFTVDSKNETWCKIIVNFYAGCRKAVFYFVSEYNVH